MLLSWEAPYRTALVNTQPQLGPGFASPTASNTGRWQIMPPLVVPYAGDSPYGGFIDMDTVFHDISWYSIDIPLIFHYIPLIFHDISCYSTCTGIVNHVKPECKVIIVSVKQQKTQETEKQSTMSFPLTLGIQGIKMMVVETSTIGWHHWGWWLILVSVAIFPFNHGGSRVIWGCPMNSSFAPSYWCFCLCDPSLEMGRWAHIHRPGFHQNLNFLPPWNE